MKKLLALVLCVMLFVSIVPTSAFAYNAATAQSKYIGADSGTNADGWYGVKTNKDAIDDLKDAIDGMFGALAANQTVFSTAKSLHDITNSMATAMFADVEDITLPGFKTVDHDDLVSATRGYLKSILGAYVNDYVMDRKDAWYDADDETIDTAKYMKIYTDGVTKSLTSSKAQKGIEALVYSLAALKVADSVNDELGDMRDAMIDWNDYGSKWAEFGWDFYGPNAAGALSDLWAKGVTPVLVPGSSLTENDILTIADVIGAEASDEQAEAPVWTVS